MNTDKKIKELYSEVFDEMHASDELLRKVTNMTEHKGKKSVRTAIKIAYAAAAAAVLLVAGNVVAYAATGDSLVSVILRNGERMSLTEVSDGVYEGVYEKDGYDYNIVLEGDFTENDSVYLIDDSDAMPDRIETEDGRTYLIYGDDRLDITEDYADGEAEGTVNSNGLEYKYYVDKDGNVECELLDVDESYFAEKQ